MTMQRIHSVETSTAQGRTKDLLETAQKAFGVVPNRRTKAALEFAHNVLESRGKVSDQQLADVRLAGYGDTEIVEIVASVVLGCFTNFLNNVADTELDIPKAEPVEACSTSTCTTAACSVR